MYLAAIIYSSQLTPLTICRSKHYGACLLHMVPRPPCFDLDKASAQVVSGGNRRSVKKSAQQPRITNSEVVIAHKPLSVLITPEDPEGWSVHVSEVLTLCSSVQIGTP